MRRALEKLNYPRHWTVDAAGSEVDICRTHEFSYSVSPVAVGKFGVTQKQAEKVVAHFKQFVVTGK
jgi:eukaryotic-like serine/threonine-protein kinase